MSSKESESLMMTIGRWRRETTILLVVLSSLNCFSSIATSLTEQQQERPIDRHIGSESERVLYFKLNHLDW